MLCLPFDMLATKDQNHERKQLSRLNPFEGLCLTSNDLLDEQIYHRQSLQNHSRHLWLWGGMALLNTAKTRVFGYNPFWFWNCAQWRDSCSNNRRVLINQVQMVCMFYGLCYLKKEEGELSCF